jgi:hypothetical protein
MAKKVYEAVKEHLAKQGEQISLFELFEIEDVIIKVRRKKKWITN